MLKQVFICDLCGKAQEFEIGSPSSKADYGNRHDIRGLERIRCQRTAAGFVQVLDQPPGGLSQLFDFNGHLELCKECRQEILCSLGVAFDGVLIGRVGCKIPKEEESP